MKNEIFLTFEIDSRSAVPVYEQIKSELKLQILSGNLKPGDQLLPIREYSKLVKVNPNTIVKVYYQMDIEGFIFSKPGLGYFVKDLSDSVKVGKEEIFMKITDEYINRVSGLGYTLDDVNKYLKKYFKKLKSKTGGKK